MLSFVFVFITFDLWPYLLALPFWAIGMLPIAPSKGNRERRQQEITAQGSSLQLAPALSENLVPAAWQK